MYPGTCIGGVARYPFFFFEYPHPPGYCWNEYLYYSYWTAILYYFFLY
eukprot:SAG11_NODE_1836_length_4187_cov_69.990460_6_plen_48_part_00